MRKDEFIEALDDLKISYTEEMLNQLEIYKNYLQEYNEHTNLTAIKDDEGIYLKHFYDSLTISKVIDLTEVDNLLDIGTGAGFPGMVLKIFYPHLEVTLLDSNNKKIKFLTSLQEKLNLNVTIIKARIEDYAKDNLNKYTVVTSRAVANLRVLSELALPLVRVNGYFIPLKGNVSEEMPEASSTLKKLNAVLVNKVTFNLANNAGIRNILKYQKLQETNKALLRSYDKIIKKSL